MSRAVGVLVVLGVRVVFVCVQLVEHIDIISSYFVKRICSKRWRS